MNICKSTIVSLSLFVIGMIWPVSMIIADEFGYMRVAVFQAAIVCTPIFIAGFVFGFLGIRKGGSRIMLCLCFVAIILNSFPILLDCWIIAKLLQHCFR